MKKRSLMILLAIMMITVLVGCGNTNVSQPKENTTISQAELFSWENIPQEDVKEVEITCTPPEETVQLNEEQKQKVLDILHKCEVVEKVSEEELAGQSIQCKITKKDGDVHRIQVVSPYMIVDDVWYRMSEESQVPCDELDTFVHELVDE